MSLQDHPAEWQRTWHGLFDILGCKWTFHIIRLLSVRDGLGFNDMERILEGITATMLSRRLKQLQSEGIIHKEVKDTSPPSTAYGLTETGQELSRILQEIEDLNPRGSEDAADD